MGSFQGQHHPANRRAIYDLTLETGDTLKVSPIWVEEGFLRTKSSCTETVIKYPLVAVGMEWECLTLQPCQQHAPSLENRVQSVSEWRRVTGHHAVWLISFAAETREGSLLAPLILALVSGEGPHALMRGSRHWRYLKIRRKHADSSLLWEVCLPPALLGGTLYALPGSRVYYLFATGRKMRLLLLLLLLLRRFSRVRLCVTP